MAKTVLIVDDNYHLRQILGSVLRQNGFGIVEAGSGSEAIQKAISEKPDVIMLDLELPDMTGTNVARMLKNELTTAAIPIVGLTAFIGSQYRDSALEAGMVDCLVKPVPLAVISKKLDEFIFSAR
jgi:CheY-like chemotaxis protein